MSLKLQIKYFIYELSSKHDLHRSLLGLSYSPIFSIIHFLIKIVEFFNCSDDKHPLNIGLKLNFFITVFLIKIVEFFNCSDCA